MRSTYACIVLLASLLPVCATAQSCRFYFATQYDWAANRGFYLDVEGCEVDTLRLIVGVADGTSWRFVDCVPPFVCGERYASRAVITPEAVQLYLNDELVGESAGGFEPMDRAADLNITYPWSADPGDYLIVQENATLTVATGNEETARVERSFAENASRPLPLQFFERGAPSQAELPVQPGQTVTIETTFRVEAADVTAWAPLVDRFGQCVYADWPTKVKDEEELRRDIAREAARLEEMPVSREYDPYGGYLRAGWTGEATGFFHTTRRNGYWWLITPDGNPCFYLGVCAAPTTVWPTTPVTNRPWVFEWLPPKDGPWAGVWGVNLWGAGDGTEYACLYACNLIRKYGPDDWGTRNLDQAVTRLRAWGFHGGGKWGSPEGLVDVPVLNAGATPSLAGHIDVFDPDVCDVFRGELEKQMGPRIDDPLVLGWSFGNEYDQIIKRDEIVEIMQMGADVPAERALVDHAVRALHDNSVETTAAAWQVEAGDIDALYASQPKVPDGDIEALRQVYEDRYYETIYRTIKEVDPNHLYLGNWIVPTWWESEEDWRIHARHCDVIGFDRYAMGWSDELVDRLVDEADKPILCGEYSFPAWYGGQRGFGRFHTAAADDADAGELYRRWVADAAADPHAVGMLWFHYRDQPITGRGPGAEPQAYIGEHFAFGLITETDRPKWDLVQAMRETNLGAAAARIQAAEGGK